ncbi:MAG: RNA methyltransferase, partial [Gammaproteobacteria bacterium]
MNADGARIVLKDTTHPGNIGAAARAMKTMGFSRLVLAAPKTLIDSQSRAMAAGAADILDCVQICEDLPEAVGECAHVFGFSARPRDLSPAQTSVRQAAATAAEKLAAGEKIAFVFGGERSGLDNDAMRRCGYAVHIPAASAAARRRSLNLAQAVQIAVYELRLALHGNIAKP